MDSPLNGVPEERIPHSISFTRTGSVFPQMAQSWLRRSQARTADCRSVVGLLHGGESQVLTPLSRHIGFPIWSRDGRWIAAEERAANRSELVVIPAAGGEIRTVAKDLIQYLPFDWSPDRRRILFAGLPKGSHDWNIYWLDVASGKTEQVTHFRADFGFVRYPVWSPKGDSIIFERNDQNSNIYVADLEKK